MVHIILNFTLSEMKRMLKTFDLIGFNGANFTLA